MEAPTVEVSGFSTEVSGAAGTVVRLGAETGSIAGTAAVSALTTGASSTLAVALVSSLFSEDGASSSVVDSF